MRSVRRPLLTKLLLWSFGVVATTLLSLAMAHLGLVMFVLSTLCSGAPSTDTTCLAAYFLMGACWATPSIVVFAWRNGRAANSRKPTERRGSRAMGYALQVLAMLVIALVIIPPIVAGTR